MAKLILLHKPFHVLSQFTDSQGRATLGDYVNEPGVYPAGRLDYDSEGLILLTDNGALQQQITDPNRKMPKVYWAQVEGVPSEDTLNALRKGVLLKDGRTRPAKARRIDPPALSERNPPVRYRASVPTCWIELELTEGKNRQVRRMTAAVGHPTLRLFRHRIGPWTAPEKPGDSHQEQVHAAKPAKRTQRPKRAPKGVRS